MCFTKCGCLASTGTDLCYSRVIFIYFVLDQTSNSMLCVCVCVCVHVCLYASMHECVFVCQYMYMQKCVCPSTQEVNSIYNPMDDFVLYLTVQLIECHNDWSLLHSSINIHFDQFSKQMYSTLVFAFVMYFSCVPLMPPTLSEQLKYGYCWTEHELEQDFSLYLSLSPLAQTCTACMCTQTHKHTYTHTYTQSPLFSFINNHIQSPMKFSQQNRKHLPQYFALDALLVSCLFVF